MKASAPSQGTSQGGEQADLALAERWARVCVDLAVFPEANARIQSAVEAVVEDLGAVLGRNAKLRILFRGDRVLISGEPVALEPDSRLAWMAERLRAVPRAGLEIGAGVTPDEMLRFASGLAQIRPLGSSGVTEALDESQPCSLDSESIRSLPWSLANPSADPLHQRHDADLLASLIAADPALGEALDRLAATQAAAIPDAPTDDYSVDLLEALQTALPAEVLQDIGQCAQFVRESVELVSDRLAASPEEDDPLTGSSTAAQALHQIADQIFRRIDSPDRDAEDREARKNTPKQDRHKTPDAHLIDSVLLGWAALPIRETFHDELGDLHAPAEQALCALHMLQRSQEASARNAARNMLIRALDQDRAQAVPMLVQHAQDALQRRQERWTAQLAALAEEFDCRPSIEGMQRIRDDWTIWYPTRLLTPWLREQAIAGEAAADRLIRICKRLDAALLIDCPPRLPLDQTGCEAMLFAHPDPALMPLWAAALKQGEDALRPTLERALLACPSGIRAREVLELFRDCRIPVPARLLRAICQSAAEHFELSVRHCAADALCHLLRATRQQEGMELERGRAIQIAAHYPDTGLRECLEDLGNRRGRFAGVKTSRSLRRIAVKIARDMPEVHDV